MTIKEATLAQLYELHYKELSKYEVSANNLKIINSEIAERNTPMEETKDEEVVEPVEATPEAEQE